MYILNKLVFSFCCYPEMKYVITSIIISLILTACNPDKNKRADPGKVKFSTTDDAEIFFRNLRQRQYDKEEVPEAKLDVFRHSDSVQKAAYPVFQLALVVNWRYDEAYLLMEPNENVDTGRPVEIRWNDVKTGKSGIYTFSYGSKEDHLRFAGQLYDSIREGHALEYLSGAEQASSFLNDPEEREVFRISMFDFYRLTGNI